MDSGASSSIFGWLHKMEATIRNLNREEVLHVMGWAAQEGWNPGLQDSRVFHEISPQAFWGAFVDGELAASISLISYEGQFGFLGLYICKPTFRGRGIGLKLWTHVMERNRSLPTIGLDGVVAQQENYRKSGFQYAYGNSRFGCLNPLAGSKLHPSLRKIGAIDLPQIRLFESEHYLFPADRSEFLSVWLRNFESLGLWNGGKLAGYGSLRACHDGYKIGPWLATSPTNAEVLLEGLLSLIPRANVYVDVPVPNSSAVNLVKSLGFVPSFETARMYRGKVPDVNLSHVFGVTTLELG